MKSDLIRAVGMYKDDVLHEGIVVGDVHIRCTPSALAYLSTLANTSANEVSFKTETGWLTLTKEQACTLVTAVSDFVQHCFTVERTHCDALSNLESYDELRMYDYRVGWR